MLSGNHPVLAPARDLLLVPPFRHGRYTVWPLGASSTLIVMRHDTSLRTTVATANSVPLAHVGPEGDNCWGCRSGTMCAAVSQQGKYVALDHDYTASTPRCNGICVVQLSIHFRPFNQNDTTGKIPCPFKGLSAGYSTLVLFTAACW